MSLAAHASPSSNDFFGALKSRREAIEARYRRLTPASFALHTRARERLPGGFTRDAVIRLPYAPFIRGADGAVLTDVDGRRIVDFWFNATSLPLGHAHPAVVTAVQAQLPHGTAYYAPTEHELDLADLLAARLPSAERVRFTNSGSEAVMIALRLARGFTGRQLVLKFEGSYHGSYDDVSWSVGPPADRIGPAEAPVAVPESLGLAPHADRVRVLPFNDSAALAREVERSTAEIAAILVEPMANRMGLLMPDRAFLEEARRLADAHGIVLIFDEVIAFRVGYHGAQGEVGVRPDMTTLGKIIGGGFPVGAVAGRADILEVSAHGRASRVTHAGTFNANPVTAVAGCATLERLTPEAFARINATGARVRARLGEICEGLPLTVTGEGSLFKVTATPGPIRNYRDSVRADMDWERLASLALLAEGHFLTTNLAGCVSTVTTDAPRSWQPEMAPTRGREPFGREGR